MKPLEDIRIIAIEQYGAGPFGSMHLADLGAEVIKIEDPGLGETSGDTSRRTNTTKTASFSSPSIATSEASALTCRSRRAGPFSRTWCESDVVYSNLRGDVPAKLGICFDDLKDLNPRIVCCSLTGFGMTGPRAEEPGYDYVLQGIAGWMNLTGEPDGPPAKSGLSLVDYSGGLVAAISMLAAVHAARRDGRGADCDLSLFDTALGMLTYPAIWQLNGDFTPRRTKHSAHPSLVPFQAFQAADRWLVVACPKEKFWQRLTTVIGRPELATDPRFLTFAGRRENAEELLSILDAAFLSRTCEVWLRDLRAAGVPSGPVNTVEQALDDPQTAARGMVVETSHPRFGAIRQVASPVRVGPDTPEYRRAPARNEDMQYVLTDILNYDETRIGDLVRHGALGDGIG